MIPIVSITDLVLAVLCFGISAKLFASYKTKPSQLMRYFLAFYLFFAYLLTKRIQLERQERELRRTLAALE